MVGSWLRLTKRSKKEARASGNKAEADKLQRYATGGPDKPLLGVEFLDAEHGLAVGAYGLILRTSDGGRHWEPAPQLLAPAEERHIYGIRRSGAEIWLVGEQGLLYRSRDGGEHFAKMTSPAEVSWFGIVVQGDERLLFGLRGALWRSSDGGATWVPIQTETRHSFVAGLAVPTHRGFVLADDGGELWMLPIGSGPARRLSVRAGFPLAGLTAAGEGLVASGFRGTLQFPASAL